MAELTYGACYAAFYGGGPPIEVPFLQRLVRSYDLGGELCVLDLGCGTGRLLRPLAALGWRVVGMDPQEENLQEAWLIAAQTAGGVQVVPGGFADLAAVEAFDVVLSVGGPWWYLLNPTERADALSRVRRALRPGGVVVLEGANFEWILDHYREPEPSEANVGGTLVRRVPRHDIDPARATWTHTDSFSARGAREDLTMVHRLAIIPAEAVLAALRGASFDGVESYPGWGSTAPGPPYGPRIIAVGRRHGPTGKVTAVRRARELRCAPGS